MARRRRLLLDERRAQLLSLARAAFSTNSYDDVSIDHLAHAAGVSKGLFYHYFSSKRELYLASVREIAEQLLARIAPDPELAPFEQAFCGVDAYLRYVRENADAYLSLMQSGIGRDEEVFAIVERTRHRFVRLILDRAGESQLAPLQRNLVHGWVGMVEAACLDWLKQRDVEREQLSKLLVKTLLFSLSLGAGEK
jgi:AcrR family transcriptional regulator